jgi:hypothetical protein
MAMREFVLNNFRWKLTALVLAMLVWFVIKFPAFRGITGGRSQTLTGQTIMVLKTPGDPRVFRILPPQVAVTVQASRDLQADDLEVFVNLTAMADVDTTYKQVLVRGGDGARIISIQPWGVNVERVGPNRPSSTNTVKRP